jgi:hypothetical protein
MTKDQDGGAAESPMQRALRMKKTALDAKPTPPRGGRLQRKETAGVAAGKSKPWMKK